MTEAGGRERWRMPGGDAWSRAVVAGPFVFVSTTTPTDTDGRLAAGEVRAQTRAALESLASTLEAAGTNLARAATVNVYLRTAADFAAMNEVYRGYWRTDPPARTTIVARLPEPETLVEMSAVGLMPGASRQVVHPKGWAASPNPYSYGIKSGDTLFLSGLVPRNPRDHGLVQGDVAVQTSVVLANGREILAAAGMTLADVVSARVFIAEPAAYPAMNEAYSAHFAKDPPARATVVCELMNPSFSVEITLVAMR